MAKRKITKSGGGAVLEPAPTKTHERRFEQAMSYMVDLMGRLYKNQVLLELNKGTVEKFEDALPESMQSLLDEHEFKDKQIGNFATVFLSLAGRAERALKGRFSEKRIEKLVSGILDQIDRRDQSVFYESIEGQVGISAKELAASEGLTFTRNALKLETAEWAKRLRDETLSDLTANTLRQMAYGTPLDEILGEFDGLVEKRKNHAQFVARNQIGTYNALVNKARSENLGITEAEWVTAGDEEVRPCHQARNGKVFKLGEGLYSSCDRKSLLPGQDWNCRCRSRYIIPEPEDE